MLIVETSQHSSRHNNAHSWLWAPAYAGATPSVANPTRRANHLHLCQALQSEIFRFTGILIYGIHPLSPRHHEGRSRDRHGTLAPVAMDAAASGDLFTGRNVRSVRRSRVVLAPRPWRQVGAKHRADDGGKTGRSPGRARRKP